MQAAAPRWTEPLYVSCHLSGGLGNQMFQAAAVLGCVARLRKGSLRPIVPAFPQMTSQTQTRTHSYNAPGEILSRLNRGPLPALSQADVYVHMEKKTFAYDEIRPPQPDAIRALHLVGYFQSARYFDTPQGQREVYESFAPFPDFAARMAARYPWFGDRTAPWAAVHIRRGDYLRLQNIHFVQPEAYYVRAAAALTAALGAAPDQLKWLVFSDDIAWCREHLSLRQYRDVCFIDDTLSDQDALWLMGACDHHITCNSTFSWWGAHLRELQRLLAGPAGSQARQVVVAPRQWFAPAYQAQLDISGRYNPGWIAV